MAGQSQQQEERNRDSQAAARAYKPTLHSCDQETTEKKKKKGRAPTYTHTQHRKERKEEHREHGVPEWALDYRVEMEHSKRESERERDTHAHDAANARLRTQKRKKRTKRGRLAQRTITQLPDRQHGNRSALDTNREGEGEGKRG